MSEQETEVLERLFRLMTEDWELLRAARLTVREVQSRLRARAAQALALGSPTKRTARCTRIPETNLRRWAEQAPATDETAGAA